jgi:hypothetical protein
LKIFVDALQALFDKEPMPDFADDDFAASAEDFSPYDESGGAEDIRRDLIDAHHGLTKSRRKIAQKKWNESEAGKAFAETWRQSDACKAAKAAWKLSDAGKASRQVSRHAWKKSDAGKASKKAWKLSETGKASTNTTSRKKSLEKYLDRDIVAIDCEGRPPLHTIDDQGRTPLEAHKATGCLKHLTKDSSGHYWESHELSLIGAAKITRPYGTPIEQAVWEPPVWVEITPKNQTEQSFKALLSLPEHFPGEGRKKPPLFLMFSAGYDWSMWLQDIGFGKAFEIARQRGFEPACRRMRGMVFWRKYCIKIRPYFDFKLSELRWPDDPHGKKHTDDPAYKKPGKNGKPKLQIIRRITIVDTFRFSQKSFVETIKPLKERGIIPKEVFDTIKREKDKRGSFHLEKMENIKTYCGYELHSLCCFMHMIRDACWTAGEFRLKSFHSPAAIASELLKRIGVRSHSWEVKSVDLAYEQIIAHWAYFGGRFEWMLKGYSKSLGYQIDLASAYPYAMQFLPSMAGGRWEKWNADDDATKHLLNKLTRKTVEKSCILSVFRVRFNFYSDAPSYPLPYRMKDGTILYPRMGYGYAFDWCRKNKIPTERAVIIEEANFFHPAPEAVQAVKEGKGPFALLKDVFDKRIEFDKADPKGPEQDVLKKGINSAYGKLAEKRYRGDDPDSGKPIIPPYACPWYAAAITAHTRRELMKAALLEPECVTGYATDAIYSQVPLALPRLKSESDIKAGKEDKLLGDWCWSKVPASMFVQSGLMFSLGDNGNVIEVKCRGLPIKKIEKAQKFLDDVLKALDKPY